MEKELEQLGLELVIGLETHVRLNTNSKLFCSCPNQESEIPNKNICPVCTGQMGVLPAVNKEAVYKAIAFGKSIDAHINEIISWDRKHYEYPDLPKNFQLTQFQKPIIVNGRVNCFRDNGSIFHVNIEQVHIEEDAAKLIHRNDFTLVDFNKGGVPLIEVVTKPCISSIKDAAIYAQYIQRIVQNLEISDANLEKGEFKSDASISIRKIGGDFLNPRTEIKNLNSFKFLQEALEEEANKQLDYYKENGDFRPEQTTVLWDEELKQTKTMRKKEFAADYRYLLEPDIPNVDISEAIEIVEIERELLPFRIEEILINGGIRPQDAKFFTSDTIRSRVFLSINKKVNDVSFVAKTLTNVLKPEDYYKINDPEKLADLFILYKNDEISPALFQESINNSLHDDGFDYHDFVRKNSLDSNELESIIDDEINKNTEISSEIREGDLNKSGILVGKILKRTGKGASGKFIRTRIIEKLGAKVELENITIGSDSKTNKEGPADESEHSVFDNFPIIIKDNYNSVRGNELNDSFLNQTIRLAGWVNSVRDHGELIFIDLRDPSYEVVQIRVSKTNFSDIDVWSKLKPESVVSIEGQLIQREEDDYNPNLRTGKLELDAKQIELINPSKTLPFEIKYASKANETVRFKYKYLDQRSKENRSAIINRYKLIKQIRDILDKENFIEVETPVLTAGTEEGAREFIVPSRKFAGKFYTLPQAPQQFKQMLMVGGIDKYFQIARCFRDEDSRGDRQPEFTQLDMEMAYVSQEDVMNLNSSLLIEVIKNVYGNKWEIAPFKILTYKEAIEKYGTDRPDLRYGLELEDITEEVKSTSFQVFKKPIDEGGIVKCIKVSSQNNNRGLSKGQIEQLTEIAKENGLGGLAYIIVNEDNLQSPIIKYLGEDVAQQIIKKSKAQVGDIVFFSAADAKTTNRVLDIIRQEIAKMLKLIKPNLLCPAWVIDFPQFELTDEGSYTFSHNPFSMPKIEDLNKHMAGKDIGKILAQQYDLILNGFEIGGGSIRAHRPEILEATFKNMGYNKEEMLKSVGNLYEAFHFGAPPHGGIAWGVDRLVMILEKKNSIREVMAFPKTGNGEDLLFNCPSELPDRKLKEANIQRLEKK